MIGAIAGDVTGSVHEGGPARSKDSPLFQPGSRFTDDTVLSIAVATVVMNGGGCAASLRKWGRRYPDASLGPIRAAAAPRVPGFIGCLQTTLVPTEGVEPPT